MQFLGCLIDWRPDTKVRIFQCSVSTRLQLCNLGQNGMHHSPNSAWQTTGQGIWTRTQSESVTGKFWPRLATELPLLLQPMPVKAQDSPLLVHQSCRLWRVNSRAPFSWGNLQSDLDLKCVRLPKVIVSQESSQAAEGRPAILGTSPSTLQVIGEVGTQDMQQICQSAATHLPWIILRKLEDLSREDVMKPKGQPRAHVALWEASKLGGLRFRLGLRILSQILHHLLSSAGVHRPGRPPRT